MHRNHFIWPSVTDLFEERIDFSRVPIDQLTKGRTLALDGEKGPLKTTVYRRKLFFSHRWGQ